MTRRRGSALLVTCALMLAACTGNAVLVERRTGEGELLAGEGGSDPSGSALAKGGSKGVNVGGSSGSTSGGSDGSDEQVASGGGTQKCATTSNPEQGFTASTLKLGTIIPLTGALRPLGEQTARVMRLAIDRVNQTDKIPGPYPLNWGCPERPGVFGRKLELEIFALQANTPEEALSGMRRLIDVEKVFLVRDCYLQSNLMGPALQYSESNDVPTTYCWFSEMGLELAPHSFSPGTSEHVSTAIQAGYLFKKMKRKRVAVLADPGRRSNLVPIIKNVAKHFGHPIPNDCIVYKKAQEASSGMDSEITRIRTCYGGTNPSPDAVMATDALNAVFGAREAAQQGWRGATNNVQWSCGGTSCWVTTLADICGDACAGMITHCASLPCVPWASETKYPSVKNFNDFHEQYASNEPEDILTYAPAAITSGLALWLTMTGPDLSREKFVDTLQGLNNWSAGIGPINDIRPYDHYGAKSHWIIKYTGRAPWFDDVTGDFITLQDVGVPAEIPYNS